MWFATWPTRPTGCTAAHFPLVVWIPIALGGLSLSAVSKLGLVVAASIGSLLAIREAGRLVTARFGIRAPRRARLRRVPRRASTTLMPHPARAKLPYSLLLPQCWLASADALKVETSTPRARATFAVLTYRRFRIRAHRGFFVDDSDVHV